MSSATLATFIFGGDARYIAVGSLLIIGASLTLAPVVYVALERLLFVKVAAVVVLMLLAIWFAITPDSWRALPSGFSSGARFPSELGFALLLAASAFAGAGGGQNLCQSNYIRDKGFGMGRYVPRLVSPVTGVEEAAPVSQSFIFETNPGNMARWLRWWRFANVEQLVTFVLVTMATICLTSMLAHSTLYGRPNLENSVSFLLLEGRALQTLVGSWFGVLFWAIGAFSLFATSMGIVDYTSRLAADVIKSTYLRGSTTSESAIYFRLVWGMVTLGVVVILSGFNQPVVLLVISACTGGVIMFLYSFLLIVLNRGALPEAIKPAPWRVATLVWSTLFFGSLAALTIWQQLSRFI
jgi:hypothetical protein